MGALQVLITGGHGFIGGRLGEHFARLGHSVLLGSRLEREAPKWLSRGSSVVTVWNSPENLHEICRGADIAVHCAGVNAPESEADPASAYEQNASATSRLVRAAERAGVRRFVYISTAHVYRSPLVGRITEETCPVNAHPYASSHLAGENAVIFVGRKTGMTCVVARLSNAFGAPMNVATDCWGLLVNDLCRQAASEGTMVLRSAGQDQRDFIPMSEACRAIEYLACGLPGTEGRPELFNVGSGSSLTVFEMAKLVAARAKKVFGSKISIERPAAASRVGGDMLEYRTDKLCSAGFAPRDSRDAELDSLLEYARSHFGRSAVSL